ncbi:MAG TPA: outer membrane beta-barrel protein [Gemmatimonadaceae bacterium]|nr:outer membrane beta-barrel protein [Gemmatimonadaceae bacterium]
MHPFTFALGALLAVPALCLAQAPADTSLKVTFGGFIDTYYAYDFGRPPSFDRSFAGGATFTTQPARHNEFNVNLAYIEARIAGDRIHGRVAVQAGTAVQSNYAGEPTNGIVSGPSLSRSIQEAYAGYRVAPTLWVDGGIFYSNMGMESWTSKDNLSYTRSLVGDYSPYYSSGVRAMWQTTPVLAVRLDVVNGWQNISETNTSKGLGLRIDYAASPGATVSYYNFVNDETGGRLRVFNGVGGTVTRGATSLLGEVDYGTLGAPSAGGERSNWWGFTAIARQRMTRTVAVVGRVERYADPGQVNMTTGLPYAFQGNGASLGIDVSPDSPFMWRTEVRGFQADAPLFPNGNRAPRKTDVFVVSSFSLTF